MDGNIQWGYEETYDTGGDGMSAYGASVYGAGASTYGALPGGSQYGASSAWGADTTSYGFASTTYGFSSPTAQEEGVFGEAQPYGDYQDVATPVTVAPYESDGEEALEPVESVPEVVEESHVEEPAEEVVAPVDAPSEAVLPSEPEEEPVEISSARRIEIVVPEDPDYPAVITDLIGALTEGLASIQPEPVEKEVDEELEAVLDEQSESDDEVEFVCPADAADAVLLRLLPPPRRAAFERDLDNIDGRHELLRRHVLEHTFEGASQQASAVTEDLRGQLGLSQNVVKRLLGQRDAAAEEVARLKAGIEARDQRIFDLETATSKALGTVQVAAARPPAVDMQDIEDLHDKISGLEDQLETAMRTCATATAKCVKLEALNASLLAKTTDARVLTQMTLDFVTSYTEHWSQAIDACDVGLLRQKGKVDLAELVDQSDAMLDTRLAMCREEASQIFPAPSALSEGQVGRGDADVVRGRASEIGAGFLKVIEDNVKLRKMINRMSLELERRIQDKAAMAQRLAASRGEKKVKAGRARAAVAHVRKVE